MVKIFGRENDNFESLYFFHIKDIDVKGSLPQTFLDALNARVETHGSSSIINIETPELKLSGRALTQKESSKVIKLWNKPDGEDQDRCHIPHHGIATFKDGVFDWFACICFLCSNIHIGGHSSTLSYRIISADKTGMNHDQAFKNYLDGLHPSFN